MSPGKMIYQRQKNIRQNLATDVLEIKQFVMLVILNEYYELYVPQTN